MALLSWNYEQDGVAVEEGRPQSDLNRFFIDDEISHVVP